MVKCNEIRGSLPNELTHVNVKNKIEVIEQSRNDLNKIYLTLSTNISEMKPSNLLLLLIVASSCNTNFKSVETKQNKYNLTITENLKDKTYTLKIEDFYRNGKEGTFLGKNSIEIYYKIFKQNDSDRAILISSGRTEAAIKYKELIYDLYNNGFSVYIHDHRGQGLSGRMAEDSDMGFVNEFQYYIDDMKLFYEGFLLPENFKNKYLLTHSMGGAIGMTYLEQFPNDFNAAAFSSPMLGLNPPSCAVVKILEGDEPEYVLGAGKYNDDYNSFEGNTLTGNEIRFDRMVDAFNENPKAKLGGASYQWVYKSCQQFEIIFDNIDKIQTPFILFSAENEQIVNKRAHQNFIEAAQKLNKNCKAFKVENAQHELFIEKDRQRIETISEMLNFYGSFN